VQFPLKIRLIFDDRNGTVIAAYDYDGVPIKLSVPEKDPFAEK
jgi:hypothetical protein